MTVPTVAFDLTPAHLDLGGSGVYTRELGKALADQLGERFIPIACPATRPPSPSRTMRDRAHTLARDLWWYQGGSGRAARRAGAQIVHAPLPSHRGANSPPMIVTVFDLAALRFPEKFRRWFRVYAQRTFPGRIRRASAVLTLSESSKREILDVIGIPAERVTVVPCGVAEELRGSRTEHEIAAVRRRYALNGPFALTVGYVEPRKNLERLVRAVARARAQPGCGDVTLVHAGPAGWLSSDLPRLIEELRLGGAVRFLGPVPIADLASLYRAARVTTYPSLYEGFGLPVAEAMAAGCPVVTSDRSSMVEVAGDAGVLVDPMSVDSIADGIARLWTDEELRTSLAARGRARAERYTWSAAAAATADVYRRTFAQA